VAAKILAGCPPGLDVEVWQHPGGEPTLGQLENLLCVAREQKVEWVAAVGGGSVLDVAKAGAGLLDAPLSPVAYHDGEDIPPGAVPFVAVPTTAGTGSESTIVSVLTNAERGLKKSIRHPSFMARTVLLDPWLLASCPKHVTACSGMDALTQAVESFVSVRSTWVSDQFALKAVELIGSSLEAVFENGRSERAKDLMEGSYLAGIALSSARLGAVHGLAHPLGSRYHAAHGLVCAVCLLPVIEFNKLFIDDKYRLMSEVLSQDLVLRVRNLLEILGIESPFRGQPALDRDGIIEETLESGSTAANPRPVGPGEVAGLLDSIFAPLP